MEQKPTSEDGTSIKLESLQEAFIAATEGMSGRVQACVVIDWTMKVCRLKNNGFSAIAAGCIVSLATWCFGWLANRVLFQSISLKEAKGLFVGSLLAGVAYWIIKFLHEITLKVNRENIFNLLGTEEAVKAVQEWFEKRFSQKSQTLCSIFTALLATISLKFLLSGLSDSESKFGMYVTVFIGMFAIGNGVYCCLKCPTLASPIVQTPVKLYPYDPANTLSLKSFIAIFGKLSLGCAFIGTIFMFLMLFVRPWQDQTKLFLASAWLVTGWVAVTYCFIFPLTLLTRVVRREKNKHLGKLEGLIRDRIIQKGVENLSKEEFEELKRLVELREAISKARTVAIDITSLRSYISSLILPLVSFLIANRAILSKLFRSL